MRYEDVDWGRLWADAMKAATGAASWSSSGAGRGAGRWDEGAKLLNDHLDLNSRLMKEDEYAEKFINLMDFDSKSTVLDVGCGGGILTIPLAKRVKRVTALDVSEVRINQVRKKARLENLSNIEYICEDWRQVSLGDRVGRHDIVIASRSLGMFDLRDELKKIDEASSGSVYISRNANTEDTIRKDLHKIIGLEYHDLPSYIYVLNMLYRMGILAGVRFIACRRAEFYQDIENALNIWMWRLGNPSGYREPIGQYLLKNLTRDGRGMLHTAPSLARWAMIHWRK